jgi:hypothetical protein
VTGRPRRAPVPPPWVKLRAVPRWIIRVHGPSDDDATLWRDLVLEARKQPLPLELSILRLRMSSPKAAPPITTWDRLDVDWTTGHVRIRNRYGDIVWRFPIEASWQSVEHFWEKRRWEQELERRRPERQALSAPAKPPPTVPQAALEPVTESAQVVAERPRLGRRPEKRDATVAAMRADLTAGKETLKSLKDAKPEALASRYSVDRKTIKAALGQLG